VRLGLDIINSSAESGEITHTKRQKSVRSIAFFNVETLPIAVRADFRSDFDHGIFENIASPCFASEKAIPRTDCLAKNAVSDPVLHNIAQEKSINSRYSVERQPWPHQVTPLHEAAPKSNSTYAASDGT